MQAIETPTPFQASLSDEQLAAAVATKSAELDAKLEALGQAQRDVQLASRQLADLREVQSQRRVASTGTPDWPYLLSAETADTTALHNARKAALSEGITPADYQQFAVRSGSYFAEAPHQMCIEVGLVRGCPELTLAVTRRLQEVLSAVLLRTPRRVRNDDQRPYKHIKLFESTLSASASYFLAVNEELRLFEVRSERHGFQTILERADSLEQLMPIVEDRYFYRCATGAGE